MARYLGAKFYRGEQYYLQIDSHSEFVKDWDKKLIKMVEDAPARLPVISTYPPDSTSNWKDSIGYRMCDSEFAKAQIEWQIVRLGSSLAFDKSKQAVPRFVRLLFPRESLSCYLTGTNVAQICTFRCCWIFLRTGIVIVRRAIRSFAAMDIHGRRNFHVCETLDSRLRHI
jgi:hypothetical protein